MEQQQPPPRRAVSNRLSPELELRRPCSARPQLRSPPPVHQPACGESTPPPPLSPMVAPSNPPAVASASDSSDDELLRSTPTFSSDRPLRPGDLAWASYRGAFQVVLVTGAAKRKLCYKFVYDLVVLKTAAVFRAERRALRQYVFGAPPPAPSGRRLPDPRVAKLGMEAAEALVLHRAQTTRADRNCSADNVSAEQFLLTECDDVVRQVYPAAPAARPPGSPQKAAAPPEPARRSLTPAGDSDDASKTEEEEEERSDSGLDGSGAEEEQPPPPASPPPSADEQAARDAHAAALLAEIGSQACRRHLAAITSGRRACRRRQLFQLRRRQQLLHESGVGALDEDTLRRASQLVTAMVSRQRGAPRLERSAYVWDVMLPEAVQFAGERLSGGGRRRGGGRRQSRAAAGAPAPSLAVVASETAAARPQ